MSDSSPVARVCARLCQRTSDVRIAMFPGLADDLKSIGEAFTHLDANQRLLARATLAKEYSYSIAQADYRQLVELGREPEASTGG